MKKPYTIIISITMATLIAIGLACVFVGVFFIDKETSFLMYILAGFFIFGGFAVYIAGQRYFVDELNNKEPFVCPKCNTVHYYKKGCPKCGKKLNNKKEDTK